MSLLSVCIEGRDLRSASGDITPQVKYTYTEGLKMWPQEILPEQKSVRVKIDTSRLVMTSFASAM
jgi:hypothetical protein